MDGQWNYYIDLTSVVKKCSDILTIVCLFVQKKGLRKGALSTLLRGGWSRDQMRRRQRARAGRDSSLSERQTNHLPPILCSQRASPFIITKLLTALMIFCHFAGWVNDSSNVAPIFLRGYMTKTELLSVRQNWQLENWEQNWKSKETNGLSFG